MRISLLLFSACALFSYCSAIPIQNPNRLTKAEIWEELRKGVIQIYRREPLITVPQYSNMMIMVYTYCTKATDKLAAAKQGTKLIGEELYDRLSDLLEDYLVKLFENTSDLNNEDLLRFYTKSWAEYRFGSKMLNNIFMYLNRHWVKREVDEGRDVYNVFSLTLVKWRDHMLKRNLNARLTETVLRLIKSERDGNQISSEAVRNYIDCYVLLGMDNIEFYRENFELAFIEETRKYYEDESFKFFNENPIIDYIRHAEKRFEEETNRVLRYLDLSTSASLMKTCEDAFIKHRMDVLLSEFKGLLEKKEEKSRDLRSLHSLVSRIPDATIQLHDQMLKQVYAEGMAKIAEDAEKSVDEPQIFVDAVFELRRSYLHIVKDSLKNEVGFATAVDKALEKCINTNQITKKESEDKIAEMLAKHASDLLENKNMAETEVPENLNKVITLLLYVYNKDHFIKKHKSLLAKRLIFDTSVSEDNEKLILSELKVIVGVEFTKDMEQMLTDSTLSKEKNEQYRKAKENDKTANKKIEFNVKIIKNGQWPKFGQNVPLYLPTELEQETKRFEDFYLKQNPGRSIRWLYEKCRGEMTFYSHSNEKYTLSVSIYQMAILLQFNDNDKLSLHEITALTGIPEEYLLAVTKILLKSTLFKSKDKREQLTMASEIELNSEFKP